MRKIFLFILIVFVLTPLSWADLNKSEALSLFVKANFDYKDGRYQEAAQVYESILEGGMESGGIYYNLANSYFKQGLLGKATLNYARARHFIPRDADLKANYRYTLSLLQGPQVQMSSSVFKRFLDGFIHFFTVDEMTVILFITGLLMGGLVLVSLYLQWPKTKVTIAVCILSIFLCVHVGVLSVRSAVYRDTAFVVSNTDSKFEPLPEATTHFELFEGDNVKILKTQGLWVKIKRFDGKIGWAVKSAIEKI